jgi:hypothetical protein
MPGATGFSRRCATSSDSVAPECDLSARFALVFMDKMRGEKKFVIKCRNQSRNIRRRVEC